MSAALQSRLDAADQILDEAIEHSIFGTDPVVIVKSPPGAGKTFLVECAAAVGVDAPAMRIAIVTPGVSQLYDVAERLLEYRLPRLELAHAKHRVLPSRLVGRIADSSGWAPGLNIGPGIVVTNVHLLASYLSVLGPGSFDLMIVDEAYQLSSSDFLPVSHLATRVLMVGDPGQLDPVTSVDTANLEVGEHKIHWSAPAYVLDRFPNTPVYGLPVTRRLLPDAARLIQSSFYPDLPFTSVVNPAERKLHFSMPGVVRGIDDALDGIASGESLVAVTIPGNSPPHEEADLELARTMAQLANRLLVRQGEWMGERVLTQADIGCIDPHVISGGAISYALRQLGHNLIRVDTVEKWQGLQMPISIVRHPLSSPAKPTGFDLQAGRWCVALSRHQIGSIIVARASVTDVIRDYVHTCDTVAAGARDTTWNGFQAHRMIWSELLDKGRVFAL